MPREPEALANISLRTTPITFRMCLALAVMDKTGCSWREANEAVAFAASYHPEWPNEEVQRTVLQWRGYQQEDTTENGEQQ